jgi:hypothetical protein
MNGIIFALLQDVGDKPQFLTPLNLSPLKSVIFAALAVIIPLAADAGTYTFTDTGLDDLAHGTAYTWGLSSSANVTGTELGALEQAVKSGQVIENVTLTITDLYDWTDEPDDVLYVNILNKVKHTNGGNNSYEYNSDPVTYDSAAAGFGPDVFDVLSNPGVPGPHSTPAQVQAYTNYENYKNSQSSLGFTGVPVTPSVSAPLYDQANSLIKSSTPNGPGTWTDPNQGPSGATTLVITLSSANVSLLNNLLTTDSSTTDIGLGLSPDCHFYDSGLKLTFTTEPANVPDGTMTFWLVGFVLAALTGARRLLKMAA